MDYSSRERWTIAVAVTLILASVNIFIGCGHVAASTKDAKNLQTALAMYQAEQGHYPKALTEQNISTVLVDETRKPYLQFVSPKSFSSLDYYYIRAHDDVGISDESYEVYIYCRNAKHSVLLVTPVEITCLTADDAAARKAKIFASNTRG